MTRVDTSPSQVEIPHASSSTSPNKKASVTWTPPAILSSRKVLPDRNTPVEALQNMSGKETDPGSMSIYLCLLDDRPHLHPSLGALHKHRHHVHNIPFPSNPTSDLPVPTTEKEEWLMWKFSDEEEARRKAFLPLG